MKEIVNKTGKKAAQFWNWLNGSKTVILWGTSQILQQMVNHEILSDSKGIKFTISITAILGAGAAGHHIKKRIFNKSK